ncbi:MAG TPA: hypothetical protein VFZ89_02030 [Solirubrobacteraceae bacterium]
MLLQFTRIWLPAIVVTGGLVVMFAGGDDVALEGGAGIVGAGLAIWLLNVLHRMGVSGEHVRDEEEDARAFFDRWGHWPDEAGPGSGSSGAKRRR